MTKAMIRITADNYPVLHSAFEILSHDIGNRAGHEAYEVAGQYLGTLALFERQLAALTQSELETFVIGEASEMSDVTRQYGLEAMSDMFDDWLEVKHPPAHHAEMMIESEQYHRFPDTTMMVCCLTLRNGFHVTGESSCIDPDDYDAALAAEIARRRAKDKIPELEAYAVKSKRAAIGKS